MGLEYTELAGACEDRFKIRLDDWSGIRTVGDLYVLINRNLDDAVKTAAKNRCLYRGTFPTLRSAMARTIKIRPRTFHSDTPCALLPYLRRRSLWRRPKHNLLCAL